MINHVPEVSEYRSNFNNINRASVQQMGTASLFHEQVLVIVSDSASVAQAMEQFIFSGLSIRVAARLHTFDNVHDALQRFTPDAVIAYFTTLDKERIEQIRMITSTFPYIPILMITGLSAVSLIQEAFNAGVRGYLLELPTRETLLDALATLKDKHVVIDEGLKHSLQQSGIVFSALQPV